MVLRGRICMLAFLMAFGPEFASSAPGREAQTAAKKGAHVEKAEFGKLPDGTAVESFTLVQLAGGLGKGYHLRRYSDGTSRSGQERQDG